MILAGAAGLLQGPALATGIRLMNQDAFATARGNAFVATADNPSAIYYNPGGIVQLEDVQLRAGWYGIALEAEHKAANGGYTDTLNRPQGAPQIYSTWTPPSGRFSFGLGFYAPYGLAVAWPEGAPFRDLGTRARLMYTVFNPVVAWKINDTLSIGAGPTLDYGDAEFKLGIGSNQADQLRFRGNDAAFGGNAGLLWHPMEKHSFGISYRSPTRMDLSGHAHTQAGGFELAERADFGLNFPQHATAGWSYRPTPLWNVEADVDWTDWSHLKSSTLAKSSGNATLVFDRRSGFIYEFGVTRYFKRGLSLSAGYWYSGETVPDAHFRPIVPDVAMHVMSSGLGWKLGRWHLDATYQFVYGPWRTIQGSEGGLTDGAIRFRSHALAFSIGRSL